MDEALAGYRGQALKLLSGAGAEVGDVLEAETEWGRVTGTLVPRYLYDDDRHVVIKLASGYNVGLEAGKLRKVSVKRKGEKPSFKVPPAPKAAASLPRVAIVGTGGTIASRVDYRTGAVRPAITADELHGLMPELAKVARVEPEILLSVYSENIVPSDWTRIAERVSRLVADGVAGVVITHGTDTMGYTAAALSFALAGVPIPVLLAGAQRSSDRPSTDAVLNLTAAVSAAASAGFSGVYVAMHVGESDDKVAIHRGTRVRKNHTSARGAFESVGVPLAAVWGTDGPLYVSDGLPPRGGKGFKPRASFDPNVALLKFYPSMPPKTISSLRNAGVKALVVEGTGLGHVSTACVSALGEFVSGGGLAFMSSQCINGRVDLNVYETGRDLLSAGVVPLGDMLSESALAKAMWVLANSKGGEDAKRLMLSQVAGELTARGFPK